MRSDGFLRYCFVAVDIYAASFTTVTLDNLQSTPKKCNPKVNL